MALLIILLNALLGLSFTIGKAMLAHATPCFIVAVRMLLGGSALTAYHLFQHGSLRLASRKDWAICMIYAALSIVLFPLLRAWGLRQVPSAKAALFFGLFPLCTAATAFMLRGEQISREQIYGLLLGCCALIPLLESTSTHHTSSYAYLPELALIISVMALSSGIVTLQHLVKDRRCPPLLITGMSMLAGGLCALAGAYLNEPLWVHGTLHQFSLLLLAQTIISNIICSMLQTHLLTRYSATTMSLASFLTPVSSIIYGVLLLHEPCGWNILSTLILLAISMGMYHTDYIKKTIQKRRNKNTQGDTSESASANSQ